MAIPPAGRVSLPLASALFAGLLVLAAPSAVLAVAPSLGGISPRGLQRGTETEITLSGARLADAKELFLYSQGIQVTKFQAVSDAQVKATLKVVSPAVIVPEVGAPGTTADTVMLPLAAVKE